MFAGHFGLATIVKTKEPELPLAALFVATQLLDIIFLPLWMLGIETLDKIADGGYGEQIIHADYTHSLLGALLIATLSGYIVSKIWKKRAGLVFALVVMSHWLLDLIVHRMDMPLLPGNWGHLPLLGFGLWQYPVLSKALEIAFIILGILCYWLFIMKKQNNDHIDKKSKIQNWLTLIVTTALLLFLGISSI